MKRNGANKLSAIILVVALILTSTGIASYFTIYTPYYEQQRQKLLTFTTDLAPSYLDPANVPDADSNTVVLNIFDRLVQYKQGSTEIEPSLATSWEMPDPTTYILNLRQDVKFQDSTPFNASSVKFSIDRAIKLGGSASYLFEMVDSTEVLDTYKIKITLVENFAPFLQILAHPLASIVSQSATEKYGVDGLNPDHPIGTGPYKLDHWDSQELVLVANKDYFRGAPHFEKIIFKQTIEAAQNRANLLSGSSDAVFKCPPGVPAEELALLLTNPDLIVSEGLGSDIEYIGINLNEAPLNDPKVRQAIAYAIDYDAIIRNVMFGYAERIGGPVPPSIFGFANLTLTQRDVEKATQLLNEAGYADGFDITLTYNIDNLARRQTAEVIKNSLSEVGIHLGIKGLDFETAIDSYYAGEYDMFLLNWIPDYFDPHTYLAPQFHTDGYANVYGYSNPEVDRLIDEARSSTSETEREADYKQAQEIITAENPQIFLYVPVIYDLTRYNIANWVHSPTSFFYAYDIYRQ
jgi:peptide/nickel transport system substrate-binding protein